MYPVFDCHFLGKYQPGDKPDPKTWKANFRCAMNSLPDIEEVKDKSIKKGTNAFRVYKMLSASERHSKRGQSFTHQHWHWLLHYILFFCFQSIFIEYFVKHDTYNTVRHRIHFLDDIPNHNNPPCCTDIHFSFLIWKKKTTLNLLFVLVYYSSEITESPSSLSDLKQVAK